ncbi:HesB/IscA family protein [Paenibacillus thalictri]|uniref:Iron-sulfur cluster assembly accessory protein n=1 Tax=Paenibacillus thalictri TaxID=2527873 RepID=A0A4Q9DK70_9BACL|nr:iron-sulfur cluster assembly accessory protein [Paenibacillus thalictri]TBL71518.1 iron-sulfur cluster assembly accessory protein [Paenibacillus thalictri]
MITISEAANHKIKEVIAAEETPNLFLRLGVKGGGCSGLSYSMGFDDVEQDNDLTFETDGLKVVVDKESALVLNGVEIDFKDTGMGGGFTIHNPNAIATCGCGSSFRTAKTQEADAQKCDDEPAQV